MLHGAVKQSLRKPLEPIFTIPFTILKARWIVELE